MKLTRDPVTMRAAVQIGENLIIPEKNATIEEIRNEPIQNWMEASLAPSEI